MASKTAPLYPGERLESATKQSFAIGGDWRHGTVRWLGCRECGRNAMDGDTMCDDCGDDTGVSANSFPKASQALDADTKLSGCGGCESSKDSEPNQPHTNVTVPHTAVSQYLSGCSACESLNGSDATHADSKTSQSVTVITDDEADAILKELSMDPFADPQVQKLLAESDAISKASVAGWLHSVIDQVMEQWPAMNASLEAETEETGVSETGAIMRRLTGNMTLTIEWHKEAK